MADTVLTKVNDRIDRICFAYYGSVANGEVEIVLNANPGLEEQPILLAEGLTITLPYIAPPNIKIIEQIKLWS